MLHSTAFAAWWDGSSPQPAPGGPQADFGIESAASLDATVAALDAAGVMVVKRLTDMPWGQRFAIVQDPDGHRIGLKAPSPGREIGA